MISFNDWKNEVAYVGPGRCMSQEGTMEDAMLAFFYEGVNPWMQSVGYKWLREDDVIARKFVYLCYMINTTANMHTMHLEIPDPKHRNFTEDRDTFDFFVDTSSLVDLLSAWEFRDEIVGTRFDYLIKEFCYVWINVESGKPGAFTQKIFDAEDEAQAEEDLHYAGPDTTSKKKWDLY